MQSESKIENKSLIQNLISVFDFPSIVHNPKKTSNFLVRPSKENGVAITTTVNKIAVLVAQVYSKLPIILTIGFISVNMDPLYYILPITSIMLRSILCLIAMTELCRLVVITLFCVLFVINVVKREMHMFTNITGRSNLGGMLFYRHFAILYNFRRLWATAMLTLITTVGFIMQVTLWEEICRKKSSKYLCAELN